jgi:hypothetical protein
LGEADSGFSSLSQLLVIGRIRRKKNEPVPLGWLLATSGKSDPGSSARVWQEGGDPGRPGKYFLRRHCCDLRYGSQRKDKKDRTLRRAQKIRKRLGVSANIMEPFPERPEGKHLDTYMRLF